MLADRCHPRAVPDQFRRRRHRSRSAASGRLDGGCGGRRAIRSDRYLGVESLRPLFDSRAAFDRDRTVITARRGSGTRLARSLRAVRGGRANRTARWSVDERSAAGTQGRELLPPTRNPNSGEEETS